MSEALKGLLHSKKFWTMVAGVVITALVVLVPSLEPLEEHLTEIVGIVIATLLGQGAADFGKYAKI